MSDKDQKDPKDPKDPKAKLVNQIDIESLIKNSETFKRLTKEVLISVRLSLTGITNLVVNYEDPYIVDAFINHCYKKIELYNNTIDIDAVELQNESPGQGKASHWIDELIYGTYQMESLPENADIQTPIVDACTGKRKRNPDGLVSRKIVFEAKDFKDKTVIIKNVDYCLDFCQVPGVVDARALWIFDKFRNAEVRRRCRILLVTNKKLEFPFGIMTVNLPPLNKEDANHVLNSMVTLYSNANYNVVITKTQRDQILRKLAGLTYTQAGDALGSVMAISQTAEGSKVISGTLLLKNLRIKINKTYMENGFGLTHLTPRPWEDYICPESSNFTFDVKKIMRDFKEIEKMKVNAEDAATKGLDDDKYNEIIEALQIRIPHIFILYGKGGVGKSAFPIHLGGLLEFDVWDFNIGAIHSKWVGEGAAKMRETLKKITSASHLIVRIDEYDRAIGATGESGQGMHEAHKQVEAEFMNWLQNCQEESIFVKNNIIVVLTTNHKENITGPMLRSGRVDLVIDIDNFDAKSMKETFLTAARRMKGRGVKVLGFNTQDELQKAIESLDLDRLAELCTIKGFTVRDVETFIMEMAAHNYYYQLNGNGLKWDTDTLCDVLSFSQGSIRDDSTGELVLGDRVLLQQGKPLPVVDPQKAFDFETSVVDPEKVNNEMRKINIKDLDGIKEL